MVGWHGRLQAEIHNAGPDYDITILGRDEPTSLCSLSLLLSRSRTWYYSSSLGRQWVLSTWYCSQYQCKLSFGYRKRKGLISLSTLVKTLHFYKSQYFHSLCKGQFIITIILTMTSTEMCQVKQAHLWAKTQGSRLLSGAWKIAWPSLFLEWINYRIELKLSWETHGKLDKVQKEKS